MKNTTNVGGGGQASSLSAACNNDNDGDPQSIVHSVSPNGATHPTNAPAGGGGVGGDECNDYLDMGGGMLQSASFAEGRKLSK
jgi:hypothetical protein